MSPQIWNPWLFPFSCSFLRFLEALTRKDLVSMKSATSESCEGARNNGEDEPFATRQKKSRIKKITKATKLTGFEILIKLLTIAALDTGEKECGFSVFVTNHM